MQPQPAPQQLERIGEFVLAQQPGIHKHVGQALVNRPVYQERRHRGIHAAAQRANRAPIAHSVPDGLYRILDKRGAAPVGLCVTHVEYKVAQDIRAAVGVPHFRVELHRINLPHRILRCSDGIFRKAGHAEPLRQSAHMVAMTVPDLKSLGQTGEQRRLLLQFAVLPLQKRAAVLPSRGAFDLSPEGVRNPLHAVTNPQHGHAKLQHARVANGRGRVINGTRPARKHHAGRLIPANFVQRSRAGQDGREDLLLADSPRNQLRVLPAKIEDHHAASFVHAPPLRAAALTPRRCSRACWAQRFS